MFGHNQCCTLCNADHRDLCPGGELFFIVRDRIKFGKLVLDLYHDFARKFALSGDRDIYLTLKSECSSDIERSVRLCFKHTPHRKRHQEHSDETAEECKRCCKEYRHACFQKDETCPSEEAEECDDALHREHSETGTVELVCAIHVGPSVRKILVRDTDVRSSDHQIVRCRVGQIDITGVHIDNDASLYFSEIVDQLSHMRICIEVVVVVKRSVHVTIDSESGSVVYVRTGNITVCMTAEIMSDIHIVSAEIVSNISMDTANISVSEAVAEVSVNMAAEVVSHVSVYASEISVVADIHIVSVTEIVAVASTHIMSVQVTARMGCGADQQKNELEDQKCGEDDRDAREDLFRQIHCFKPIHKKFHLFSPFLNLC